MAFVLRILHANLHARPMSSDPGPILVAGLSPAWQQILVFDRIVPGEVNRAGQVVWCASGKALNAGRAAWALGAQVHIISSVGGQNGRAIREEFDRDGIPATWIETAAPTRVCTTLIEGRPTRVTELVENAPAVTADELAAFESAFDDHKTAARIVVLSGSLPEVIERSKPTDLYQRLLRDAPRSVLDVRGAELREALRERPFLVKPNRAELAATVGRPLSDEPAVLAAMRELNAAGAEWVLITSGGGDVLLACAREAWRLKPPQRSVVNPIGCGDCLAGALAAALSEGAGVVEAARLGIAAASENLSDLHPARLDRQRVRAAVQEVRVERL